MNRASIPAGPEGLDVLTSRPDADRVVSWVASQADAVQFAGPDVPWPLTGDTLIESARHAHYTTFLLRDRTEPVATGATRTASGVMRIGRVLVDPAARGRGRGRVLMDALIARAASEPDVRAIELGVFADNVAARHLYAELGFTPTGQETVSTTAGRTWVALQLRRDVCLAAPLPGQVGI